MRNAARLRGNKWKALGKAHGVFLDVPHSSSGKVQSKNAIVATAWQFTGCCTIVAVAIRAPRNDYHFDDFYFVLRFVLFCFRFFFLSPFLACKMQPWTEQRNIETFNESFTVVAAFCRCLALSLSLSLLFTLYSSWATRLSARIHALFASFLLQFRIEAGRWGGRMVESSPRETQTRLIVTCKNLHCVHVSMAPNSLYARAWVCVCDRDVHIRKSRTAYSSFSFHSSDVVSLANDRALFLAAAANQPSVWARKMPTKNAEPQNQTKSKIITAIASNTSSPTCSFCSAVFQKVFVVVCFFFARAFSSPFFFFPTYTNGCSTFWFEA